MASIEVIDIPSSPELPPTRVRPTPAKSNIVIELTDSEDEEPRPPARERVAVAGPSKKKHNPPLQHQTVASSGSLENIPSKRRSPSKSVPLFWPSDEENEPPSTTGHQDASNIVDVDDDDLPSTPPDPIPGFVAQVLEIIPDVDPDYVLSLVRQHYPQSQHQVVEPVLHALFEDPSYPKLDRKGKRKRVEDDQGRDKPKVAKMDYGSKDRVSNGGPHYAQLSVDQLTLDFPYIPKPHIRAVFLKNHYLYAPTYLFLEEEKRKDVLPYVRKTIPTRVPVKGKQKALHDPEFEKEREWLTSRGQAEPAAADATDADDECEDGLECGCCFSKYSFVGASLPFNLCTSDSRLQEKMIQCPEAHLFCSTCMTSYAETLLGSHDHRIVCMDQSGCKLHFPDTELHRFLVKILSSPQIYFSEPDTAESEVGFSVRTR